MKKNDMTQNPSACCVPQQSAISEAEAVIAVCRQPPNQGFLDGYSDSVLRRVLASSQIDAVSGAERRIRDELWRRELPIANLIGCASSDVDSAMPRDFSSSEMACSESLSDCVEEV